MERDEEDLQYLAEEGLRTALFNRSIGPESAIKLQGVSRPMQAASNPEYQQRIDDRIGVQKRTRLMFAAATGDVPRIRVLIRNGARRNIFDARGMTALTYAARYLQFEAMRALILEPVPPEFRFRPVEIPLFHDDFSNIDDMKYGAMRQLFWNLFSNSKREDAECAVRVRIAERMIIELGNYTPIFMNEIKLFEELELVQLQSFNNAWNVYGNILIAFFNRHGVLFSIGRLVKCARHIIKKGAVPILWVLLQVLRARGVDLNAYRYNQEPIIFALKHLNENSLSLLNLFEEFEIDFDQRDGNNTTFLLNLALNLKRGRDLFAQFAERVLQIFPGNINAVNNDGENLLGEVFARHRQADVIDLLLRLGADPVLALHSGVH
jgi:ankyrin repeat protein